MCSKRALKEAIKNTTQKRSDQEYHSEFVYKNDATKDDDTTKNDRRGWRKNETEEVINLLPTSTIFLVFWMSDFKMEITMQTSTIFLVFWMSNAGFWEIDVKKYVFKQAFQEYNSEFVYKLKSS